MSQSMTSREIAYTSISILFDSIPTWGNCHRRLGSHVILSSSSGRNQDIPDCFKCISIVSRSPNVLQLHTNGLEKCHATEEAAKVEEEATNGDAKAPEEATNGDAKAPEEATNGVAKAPEEATNGNGNATNGDAEVTNGDSNGHTNGDSETKEATKRKAEDAGDAPEPVEVSAEKIAKLKEAAEEEPAAAAPVEEEATA